MCEKVNFNVIEKNKYDNVDDITKYIQEKIGRKFFTSSLV